MVHLMSSVYFFFFNDTATTEIYTLSLHDALPISSRLALTKVAAPLKPAVSFLEFTICRSQRSEEHTSELQSQSNLVCRLLLEKKKNKSQPAMTDGQTLRTSSSSAHRRIGQISDAE